jgi:hypothetical protein
MNPPVNLGSFPFLSNLLASRFLFRRHDSDQLIGWDNRPATCYSERGETFSAGTNMPCFSAHLKYLTPCKLPSDLPSGLSSCTPHQIPLLCDNVPTYLTVPAKATDPTYPQTTRSSTNGTGRGCAGATDPVADAAAAARRACKMAFNGLLFSSSLALSVFPRVLSVDFSARLAASFSRRPWSVRDEVAVDGSFGNFRPSLGVPPFFGNVGVFRPEFVDPALVMGCVGVLRPELDPDFEVPRPSDWAHGSGIIVPW